MWKLIISIGLVFVCGGIFSSAAKVNTEVAYVCKEIKATVISCPKSGSDCTSEVRDGGDEIVLSNPASSSPRVFRAKGSSAFVLKRLSVTKDSSVYYLSTTGDLGGMSFYTWMSVTNRLFEVKAHNMFGDFSSTVMYQCQAK